MTSYIAKNAAQLRAMAGTPAGIMAGELSLIDSAIDAAKLQRIDLSAGLGTSTALATAGVDIASGSNATNYSVFVAERAITVQEYFIYFTEAYAKNTTDAVIAIKNEAGTPATKATYTCNVAGEAAKSYVEVSPASGQAALAKGEALDIVITSTGSSGTGHVKIFMIYTVD